MAKKAVTKSTLVVDVLKEAKVDLGKLKIDQTIKWHIFFDTRSRKPVGVPIANVCSSALVVAAPDEPLPPFNNRPEFVEEREAIMIILKK